MIVSAYTVDPIIVSAGREFDLEITFQNASSEKAVKNIIVKIEAAENTERRGAVFTPVNGSNTHFIDHIEPQGKVTKTLRMYTVPDAEARTYNLNIDFDYQDEDLIERKRSERIGINVKQTTRLELSQEPFIPEMTTPGQRVSFWFSIINSGQVSLSNVRVRVDSANEGAFDTGEANMYVGNLGRGNQMSYDGVIVPLLAGKQQGTIVVYGEDATGEIVEYKHPFVLNVMDMGGELGEFDMRGGGMVIDGGDFGIMGGGREIMREGEGMMSWGEEEASGGLIGAVSNVILIILGVLVGIAVIIAVAVIVIIRRKKNKDALNFDEASDA
jgi:hypothetical protein